MIDLRIKVQDARYEFVVELLKEFDFITVMENKKLKKELQKKALQERFIHAFKQAKLIEEGKLETRNVEEFLAELEAEDQEA